MFNILLPCLTRYISNSIQLYRDTHPFCTFTVQCTSNTARSGDLLHLNFIIIANLIDNIFLKRSKHLSQGLADLVIDQDLNIFIKRQITILISVVVKRVNQTSMLANSNVRTRARLKTFKISSSLLVLLISFSSLTSRLTSNSSLNTKLRVTARILLLLLLLLNLLKLPPRRTTRRSSSRSRRGMLFRRAAPSGRQR